MEPLELARIQALDGILEPGGIGRSLCDSDFESMEAEFTDEESMSSEPDDDEDEEDYPEVTIDNPVVLDSLLPNTYLDFRDPNPVVPRRKQDTKPFPQFQRLPFELRWLVWEFAFPILQREPRVLSMTLHETESSHNSYVLLHGALLPEQTIEQRRLQAVNQELRSKALKLFPDSLEFSYTFWQESKKIHSVAQLRFDRTRDIIYFGTTAHDYGRFPNTMGKVPLELRDKVKLIALGMPREHRRSEYHSFLEQFSHIEAVYFTWREYRYRPETAEWFTAPTTIHRHVRLFEEDFGDRGTVDIQWSFPPPPSPSQFGKQTQRPKVPLPHGNKKDILELAPAEMEAVVLPMTSWDGEWKFDIERLNPSQPT